MRSTKDKNFLFNKIIEKEDIIHKILFGHYKLLSSYINLQKDDSEYKDIFDEDIDNLIGDKIVIINVIKNQIDLFLHHLLIFLS